MGPEEDKAAGAQQLTAALKEQLLCERLWMRRQESSQASEQEQRRSPCYLVRLGAMGSMIYRT